MTASSVPLAGSVCAACACTGGPYRAAAARPKGTASEILPVAAIAKTTSATPPVVSAEPRDKPSAFVLAEAEEGLDGGAVGGPLEQGGGVDRGVVGVFDARAGWRPAGSARWPG